MALKIQEISKLLNVPARQVTRWIKEDGLPAYSVHGRVVINREEFLEWAALCRIPIPPGLFDSFETAEPENESCTLAVALKAGGIHYRISGSGKEQIFRSVIAKIRLPRGLERENFLKLLLAREALGSTAVGNGIAIPHPRNPIVLDVNRPMIALSFLETPVDFQALDGMPVHTLFTVISPTTRVHLSLISRLAFILHDPGFRGKLIARSAPGEILDHVEKLENAFPSPAGGKSG